MNTKEVHKIVSSIKTSLFKNANAFSIGMLKSHFKGTGLKFKEHQIYAHGDDVRFIDWKMLAKTNTPYIKTFEEERNVEISVLLDCSRGMYMGYEGKSKLECALEITSLLYLLSSMTGDYVQVIVCTGKKIIRIPKKQGEMGIVALIASLKDEGVLTSDGKVDPTYNFASSDDYSQEYNNKIIREFYKKKELVILSDFYNFLSGTDLKKLLLRKHVHAFRFLTPLDYSDDFKYNIKAKSFDMKKSGYVDLNMKSKDQISNEMGFKIKDLLIEKRFLEDFVKEML